MSSRNGEGVEGGGREEGGRESVVEEGEMGVNGSSAIAMNCFLTLFLSVNILCVDRE